MTPVGLAGFCAARALSKRNDEPQKASRPFDKNRDGFVFAEGVESVAVCFLHSYKNPVHEQAARDALRARAPGLPVSFRFGRTVRRDSKSVFINSSGNLWTDWKQFSGCDSGDHTETEFRIGAMDLGLPSSSTGFQQRV